MYDFQEAVLELELAGLCFFFFLLEHTAGSGCSMYNNTIPSMFCIDFNCCTTQNVCEKIQMPKKQKNQNAIDLM